MHRLKSNERLSGARNPSKQHQAARLGTSRLHANLLDVLNGRFRCGGSAMHSAQSATAKQLARRRDERRKRSIRALGQETLTSDRCLTSTTQSADHVIERIRAANMHALPNANHTPCTSRHEKRMDWAISTLPVIAPQIPRVGGNLVDIRLRCIRLPFEFQHENGAINQEHTVRPPCIEGQDILEDRAELLSTCICGNGFLRFRLERRDRITPRAELFLRSIGHQPLKRGDHRITRSGCKRWELGVPAPGGGVRHCGQDRDTACCALTDDLQRIPFCDRACGHSHGRHVEFAPVLSRACFHTSCKTARLGLAASTWRPEARSTSPPPSWGTSLPAFAGTSGIDHPRRRRCRGPPAPSATPSPRGW